MKKGNHLSVEDFVEDESFRKAVFKQDYHAIAFWENWHSENPVAYENAEKAKRILLSIKGEVPALTKGEHSESIEKIMSQLRPPVVNSNGNGSIKILMRIAAAVMLAAVCFLGTWKVLQSDNPKQEEISKNKPYSSSDWIDITNTDEKQRLVMFPDGSSALLKKNASVGYPRLFKADKREIYLAGEAFFEVSKNAQWPFVIQSGELTTKVLGTSFTIRANPQEDEIRVFVKTGRVQLFNRKDALANNAPGVVLTNQQEASFTDNQIKIIEKEETPKKLIETQAFNETFQFKRTPLADVFKTLESVYGVEIIFDEQMASSCTLTAELGDEPFTEKLKMIVASIGAQYTMEGSIVTIQLKKRCN